MGLFDSLAKQMLGGQSEQITGVLSGILNQTGGLEGLRSRAAAAGLDSQVASWIGTGGNESITPEQMRDLLGQEAVSSAANQTGFSAQQLLPLLAKFLPMIIDKLTPNGRVEQGATSAEGLDLGGVLAAVMKSQGASGGLGGLLGGLLGGKR